MPLTAQCNTHIDFVSWQRSPLAQFAEKVHAVERSLVQNSPGEILLTQETFLDARRPVD
jgi:hypothetical protein